MVALREEFAVESPRFGTQNRTGDFFCDHSNHAEQNNAESQINSRIKTVVITITVSGRPFCVVRDPMLNYTETGFDDTIADETHLAPSSDMKFTEGGIVKVQGSFYSAYSCYHKRKLLMSVSKKH